MILAKAWLMAAKDDLILLEDIKNNVHITNLIAFHSQQAIEKSLKAVIESKNQKVPKTHKLQQLFELVDIKIDLNDNLINLIHLLDELYIDSRYPNDFGLLPYGKPSLEDAKEFYEFALTVFDKVCGILNIDKSELK
jgi:HEPN domain-containing protein